MPALIEVAFKGNRKEFFLWEDDTPPPVKAAVIVDADRGEDLGHVHAVGDLAATRSAGAAHGLGGAAPTRVARRVATRDDLRRLDDVRSQDDDARRRGMERVKANNLVMKLSDAEWQWDRKKLTFYFTAEKRVDFRNLVRELAAMFRTRIELKQIGVRDEAKRLDGIGRCGRQYCSSSWLPELRPVNLGVAKDQRLSLNPSQISGACGRLMCCLRYEHEFYVQQRRRFPKEGRIIRTSLGEEKVVANDIFRERVTLRSPDGETRVVPLAVVLGGPESLGDAAAAEAEERAAASARDDDVESLILDAEAVERPRQRDERARRTARPSAASRASRAPAPTPHPAPAPTESAESDAAPPAAPLSRSTDASAEEATGEEESTAESADAAAERKAHRRRGRRGGRRNRARDRDDGSPSDGGSEPSPSN